MELDAGWMVAWNPAGGQLTAFKDTVLSLGCSFVLQLLCGS